MLYSVNFKSGKMEAIDETSGNKNNLEVGRVLHLNGYNCPDYVITHNYGINPKDTSYGASYECVNLDTGHKERKQAYTLEWLKDKTSDRIQVYITDEIMDAGTMYEALNKAQQAKEEIDRKATEEANRKKNEKAMLPARFPYLIPGDNATKNLRIELKREFPAVKFSVTTRRGTGSINIDWTDGPTIEQVKKISDKYQEGNFNGMEDIYEYNHAQVWTEIFGGARYVFENRHESPELTLRAAKEMGFDLPSGICDNYGNLPGLDSDKSRMIYRQARSMSA